MVEGGRPLSYYVVVVKKKEEVLPPTTFSVSPGIRMIDEDKGDEENIRYIHDCL